MCGSILKEIQAIGKCVCVKYLSLNQGRNLLRLVGNYQLLLDPCLLVEITEVHLQSHHA